MAEKEIKNVALVGCPNCGKTALFNALTGARQKVANYPGVTVERKEGVLALPDGRTASLIDLPGTYSLRGRSPDEAITRDVVLGRLAGETTPDAIVCVADATNLRLALRLVLEVRRLGLPMVVALNMMDIVEKNCGRIDVTRLSQELGVPVIPTVAVKKSGSKALKLALASLKPATGALMTDWQEPTAQELRDLHAEVERILKVSAFLASNSALTRKIDAVVLHPVWGTALLLALLFFIFQAVFAWAGPAMDGIKAAMEMLAAFVGHSMAEGPLRSLLVDGVIAGVGSVLVFLPQILILFFFIILLEDSGYMARAAFLMDKLMAGAGLHGRAFIPLLSSFACAIPGIMATRVIQNREDRLVSIMIAPLMTCSARLPVYTLIIGAFIPDETLGFGIGLQGFVMFCLYAAGIFSALFVSWFIKTFIWRKKAEPFLMELPSYKRPSPLNVLTELMIRAKIFLGRAGTIILAIMIMIWFLCTYPAAPDGAVGPAIHYSIAGMIGNWLQPVLTPIGFNWQIAVALIPGMAAREVAVGALSTIYALSANSAEAESALQPLLASSWSLSTALSLLAWYVFAPQCASTLAVVKRETNAWKWPVVMFAYMLVLAYAASWLTFHIAEKVFP